MRYYIYLDKPLLKSLYSSREDLEFDIEVLEYTTKKIIGSSTSICVEPKNENVDECENVKENGNSSSEKGLIKKIFRNRKAKREEIRFDTINRKENSIERKSVNIDDVTDIYNNNFFHRIIEKMYKSENIREQDRLYKASGKMNIINERNQQNFNIETNNEEIFLNLNNDFIWLEKGKLQNDINIICKSVESVEILGYVVNENRIGKIVKCVAVYIE